MEIIETKIKDLLVIKPDVFYDERGYFFESYNRQRFLEHGLDMTFVQDNESQSMKGVLRGLHFQKPPFAQGKLVRVVKGAVMDVAVASGFNSRQHFFRVFNAATGMSPQQFRQAQHVRQARQLYFFDNTEDHSYDADGRRRDPDRS